MSDRSSMVEPLASNQMTTGSIPAGRSTLIKAAKAYRAAKIGVPVSEVGERYTADIGPMRAALAAISQQGNRE